MRRLPFAAILLASVSSAAFADPVPKDQLMVPPANAGEWVVVSTSNTHGSEHMWTMEDGSIAYRKSQSLRGWITEIDGSASLNDAGYPVRLEIRGITPDGDAAEIFEWSGDKARWAVGSDVGEVEGGAFYVPKGGPGIMIGMLAEALHANGGTLDLLPSGRVTLRPSEAVNIEDESGDRAIRLYYIDGYTVQPVPVWLDQDGKFFSQISYFGLMPKGYEEHFKPLKKIQDDIADQEVKNIAARFLTDAAKAPTLIDHVLLFDAEAGTFVPDQAVLVADGKIAAVGTAGSLQAPDGARVVDGRGKTLLPGLWDSHAHIDEGYGMLQNLSWGHTNHRSPGMGVDDFVRLEAARRAGELLAPETFASEIVDAVHPLSAQGAILVDSEEAAIAAVRKIHDAGMWGVKFYTSMNPVWIAPAAAEAHKLGMHVSGHIPATMRPLEAVRAGYDEITHINFVMMQAMPQSVVDIANTAARFEGPAQYGQDVDLDGPEMTAFITELAERGIVVDPTVFVFESNFTGGDEAKLQAAYAPYKGTMPPAFERSLATGGYPLFGEMTREDFQRSWEKIMQLVDKLHEAGIPLVAGTDGWGMEVVRELELYEQAGLTKEEALQTATIVPAKVVGVADRTGSIAVGKEADLLLVDGDVSQDLAHLRHVETVVLDGYVLDGEALRNAAGFTGMPK